MQKNDEIIRSVLAREKSYGSLPFWSWNDRLTPEECRRQIGVMDEIGMHGFFMHARGGLETEYLSEEWFECVRASVDEAGRRGMEAWAYDENGWPSGFAGGKLLGDEDNLARFLKGAEETVFPSGGDVLGVYVIENGRARPAKADDAPPYLTVREATDESYVDVLRRDVIEKFIAATHEEYKRRAPEGFGTTMPGFFTDEPQYYRYAPPYSRILPRKFREKYGYDLADALPAVFWDFEGATGYRYDYYLLLHELFQKGFAEPVYEWCEKNGCRLTGHWIEESSLGGQMLACGGVMPFYKYEHIPGIDYLGRGMQSDMSSKQLGSACAQLGRKKALSETFACCGWDVSPRELKRIAEMQYCGGVNLMCQHLYPYSERGQRKRDYPAHYSEHNPWQPYMKDFDRYFARLGAVLSTGTELAPVLVVHPIRAAYRTYKRFDPGRSVAGLEKKTSELLAMLAAAHVPYHFGDEGMMVEMGAAEGASIRVGQCRYEYVIVPEMETITSAVAAMLKEFAAAGGKLAFVGEVPAERDGHPAVFDGLHGTATVAEILDAMPVKLVRGREGAEPTPELRQRIRIAEDGRRVVFTANITDRDVFGAVLTLRGCKGAYGLDFDTMETYPLEGTLTGDGAEIVLDLPAAASCVVVEDPAAALMPRTAVRSRKPAIALPARFTLTEAPENVLTLDRVSLSKDGGATWTEERPLERVRDNLLAERYAGPLALKYAFTVAEIPGKLAVVWENPSILSVAVNGTPVTAEGFLPPDRAFSRADVTALVRTGSNELVLTLNYFQNEEVYDVLFGNKMESMRNCLCFDTEIENAYLLGDFRVATDPARFSEGERGTQLYDGPFTLVRARDEVDLHNPVRDGFPFFGGTLAAVATLEWHAGDPTVLRPDGRFAAVAVTVNGAEAGTIFFNDELDLAPYLCEGANTLALRVTTALRNAAGPFHRTNPEPTGVSPRTFSYEREWKGGECADYLPRYAFVRFGV